MKMMATLMCCGGLLFTQQVQALTLFGATAEDIARLTTKSGRVDRMIHIENLVDDNDSDLAAALGISGKNLKQSTVPTKPITPPVTSGKTPKVTVTKKK
ncbi:MAG TPA: hypothetical protein VI279_08805 [Rhodocyclaceae bacterium]